MDHKLNKFYDGSLTVSDWLLTLCHNNNYLCVRMLMFQFVDFAAKSEGLPSHCMSMQDD